MNVGGSGNYKHIVAALSALSIPWVVFSDGDQGAKDGLAAAGKAIGHALDDSSVAVVLLPAGQDFEEYLLGQGFRLEIQRAIGKFFGATALEEFRLQYEGTTRPKSLGPRDYKSPGWEDRLVHDFMDKHKGTYGSAVAEEIVGSGKLIARVKEFFDRVDTSLGRPVKT